VAPPTPPLHSEWRTKRDHNLFVTALDARCTMHNAQCTRQASLVLSSRPYKNATKAQQKSLFDRTRRSPLVTLQTDGRTDDRPVEWAKLLLQGPFRLYCRMAELDRTSRVGPDWQMGLAAAIQFASWQASLRQVPLLVYGSLHGGALLALGAKI
jgi:hypothetical protein